MDFQAAATQPRKINIYPVLIADGPGHEALYIYGGALALGNILSYAKVYQQGSLRQHYNFEPLINRKQDDFAELLQAVVAKDVETPSIWLISSYVWNHNNNIYWAKKIKELLPSSIIIAGGPHIPDYEQDSYNFFIDHSEIDITVRDEGEITFAELLADLKNCIAVGGYDSLLNVSGITFRLNGKIIRTPDRPRNRDMSIYPSPYISGEFNDASFENLEGMMLETNRGCPFGCTFCDWGSATLQKFSHFELSRVKKDIDFIASKKAKSVYLTDSNFGAFARDLEISEYIAGVKKHTGYPISLGSSFAKNASEMLAKITAVLKDSNLKGSGIISIQSTDRKVLETIRRDNIRQGNHEKLIQIFKDNDLHLSSELMIGLPGQTVESHKNDLQYFFDRKLMTSAFYTSLMPNAPMNEPTYRETHKIATDSEGFVVSTATFSRDDYDEMKALFLSFQFHYVLGVLKYFLYYLQVEHSIKAMDFLWGIMKESRVNQKEFPLNHAIHKNLLSKIDDRLKGSPNLRWKTEDCEFLFQNLHDYFDEIIKFVYSRYGLTIPSTELKTLCLVQEAVMPQIEKTVPLSISLPHDFAEYFKQIKSVTNIENMPKNFMPLSSFANGALSVSALKNKTIKRLNLARLDLYKDAGWELRSVLRF